MANTYNTAEGDTLDLICWQFYGQQSGAVELVLEANPGIADLGAVLPINTRVTLPDMPKPAVVSSVIQLWD